MHFTLKTLEARGYDIDKSQSIVDFGCGAGNFIKEMRSEGYDAKGCDFKFLYKEEDLQSPLVKDGIIQFIENAPYRLPYNDNSADYIVSETVLEHVMNPEEAGREMARILKPGGAAFHFFPARLCPIESHIFVPMANIIQDEWYLKMWAMTGIRNPHQKHMNVQEVTQSNAEFLKNSTNYLSFTDMKDIYSQYFETVEMIPQAYIANSPSGAVRKLRPVFKAMPFMNTLYANFWACPLLLAGPKAA